MSWWTENRKKVLGLGALALAPWAIPSIAGLLGGAATGAASGAAAGASGAAGAAGGAGASGLGGLLGEGAATAAMTPGLSATGAGSQAAMLASQNAGMGMGAMAKTAEAAAGAQGLSPLAKFGGQAFGMADKALGGINQAAGFMGKANAAMAPFQMMGQPQQPMPMAPPPPPQAPQQPMPTFGGYGQDQPPPGMDPQLWEQLKRMRGY